MAKNITAHGVFFLAESLPYPTAFGYGCTLWGRENRRKSALSLFSVGLALTFVTA